MSCERPYDLIAVAFGDRPPDAEDHVAGCAECRAEIAALGAVREKLDSLPEIEPSTDFVARTRQAFLAATPEFKPAPSSTRAWRVIASPRWSWAIAVHAAAFLIAAVWFVYHLPVETPDPESIVPLLKGGPKPPPPPVTPDGKAAELLEAWDRALEKDPFRDLMGMRQIESVRRGNREAFGGGMTAKAVADGVRWLSTRQKENGSWNDDVRTTALAALALLTEGGARTPPIDRAAEFLRSKQDARGCVGETTADHAVAAAALVEMAVLGNDAVRRYAAEAALTHLIREQGADGAWGDAFTTAWATQALRLSVMLDSRAAVPALATADAAAGTHAWTKLMASPAPEPPAAATSTPLDRKLSSLLFGTLAMYQLGGDAWEAWNTVASARLVGAIGDDGAWPADYDLESPRPDAERATATAVLTLQTYYRYPRILP